MTRKKKKGDSGVKQVLVGSNKVKVWRRQSRFLLVDCCGWVIILSLCGNLSGMGLLRNKSWENNGLPPTVNIMQTASAKSKSPRRGASHQPTFMGSCLLAYSLTDITSSYNK